MKLMECGVIDRTKIMVVAFAKNQLSQHILGKTMMAMMLTGTKAIILNLLNLLLMKKVKEILVVTSVMLILLYQQE